MVSLINHWMSTVTSSGSQIGKVVPKDPRTTYLAAIVLYVIGAGPDVLIAAHSLGCLLVAHWLPRTTCKVRGAFLVAVPDPNGRNFPTQALGFAPVPQGHFACPSIVVASADDPYGGLEFARQCAQRWGSRFVNIGPAGHINAASGLGAWSERSSLAPGTDGRISHATLAAFQRFDMKAPRL